MSNELFIGLISAGSALVGALIGSGASLWGLRSQFRREDRLEREKRAADILEGVEGCAFTLITAIGSQITHLQKMDFERQLVPLSAESIALRDENYENVLKDLRESSLDSQKILNKQKALSRLFVNHETRNAIDRFSQLLLKMTGELIENYKQDPLTKAMPKDMPCKANYDEALNAVYKCLEEYIAK